MTDSPKWACVFCETPAMFIAAQSEDAGRTVDWVLICVYHADGWNDGGDWNAPVIPLAAPQMAEALRLFARLGLWEDNYPEGSEEHAEAAASDSRLDVWVRPSDIRKARAALRAAGVEP